MIKQDAVRLVTDCLKAVAETEGIELPQDLEPQFVLMGKGCVLDSLALVSLLLDLEQAVADRARVVVRLTTEDALSRRHSPFRTIDTLAEYVVEVSDPDSGPARAL